jgi:hypothetical protein
LEPRLAHSVVVAAAFGRNDGCCCLLLLVLHEILKMPDEDKTLSCNRLNQTGQNANSSQQGILVG